jgi:hypothetical protein
MPHGAQPERELTVDAGGQKPPARSQRAAEQESADLILPRYHSGSGGIE